MWGWRGRGERGERTHHHDRLGGALRVGVYLRPPRGQTGRETDLSARSVRQRGHSRIRLRQRGRILGSGSRCVRQALAASDRLSLRQTDSRCVRQALAASDRLSLRRTRTCLLRPAMERLVRSGRARAPGRMPPARPWARGGRFPHLRRRRPQQPARPAQSGVMGM